MICWLFSAKAPSWSMLFYWQWETGNWNLCRNIIMFIQGNWFDNVRQIAAMLSRPQYVNWFCYGVSMETRWRTAIISPDDTLRWRHNDHTGVSNHQPHGCLLNRLFRRTSKKTSKLRVTGLCAWPVTRKMLPFDDVIMKWMQRNHDMIHVRTNIAFCTYFSTSQIRTGTSPEIILTNIVSDKLNIIGRV